MPGPRKLDPPFRVDHVGSFLRPQELLDARKLAGFEKVGEAKKQGSISLDELRAIENDAIRDVVEFQESIGLQSITDGEYRRGSWSLDIMDRVEGIEIRPQSGAYQTQFALNPFRPPIPHTVAKLGRGEGGLVLDDFKFTSGLTDRTVKATMPAPMILFRGARAAVSEQVYPDLEEYFEDLCQIYRDEIADLAAAGCRYIQLDNTATALLCDPKYHDISRQQGIEPLDQLRLHARLVNGALRDKPEDVAVAMHLCRGNNAGSWIGEGGYEFVAEIMFSEFEVDAFFMEYDSERAGDFEPLRFAPKDRLMVLGIMTTKTPETHTKDELKRRIEEAAQFVPIENLAISPQCGFASVDIGNPITVDDERRKFDTLHEVAREVWGETS